MAPKITTRPLTATQSRVLEFIQGFSLENGIAPSSREIQHHFNYASQTAAMKHLNALREKGAIRNHAGKARASVTENPTISAIREIVDSKQTMTAKLAKIAELVK